jgi:hypothetical protein
MIYSAKVLFENKSCVCLVGAEDKKEALKKVVTLYSYAEIYSVELMEISKDLLEKLETFYKGGLPLAEFEDYGD